MLSVIIATHDDEARLAIGLGDLIRAAVDGLVREVIIADGGSSDATLEIAEDAGCRIVSHPGGLGARLAAACAGAKGEWLMVLPAGERLVPRWEEAVARFAEGGPGRAAGVRRAGGWFDRAARGVLTPRRLYEARGGYRDVSSPHGELLRRLGRSDVLRVLVSDPGGRR